MGKQRNKTMESAHIKERTEGTSNEISLSVLDAAKKASSSGAKSSFSAGDFLGKISLFTLKGRRKQISTPSKESELIVSSGSDEEPGKLSAYRQAKDNGSDGGAQKSQSDDADVSRETSGRHSAGFRTAKTRFEKAAIQEQSRKDKNREGLAIPLSENDEVISRKVRRRRRKIAVILASSLALATGLSIAGVYLYNDYTYQKSVTNRLNEAISLIDESDETLFSLDEVVHDPFNQNLGDKRATVKANLSDVDEKLKEADEKARSAAAELKDPKAKDAAAQAVDTITARKSLVETGGELIDLSQGALDQSKEISNIWDKLLDADTVAREASSLVKDTTQENIQASKDKTNQAITQFGSVADSLAAYQVKYPQLDYSVLQNYVAKRMESLQYAVASDDALLTRDKAAATAQNDAYTKSDEEAVRIAQQLPEDPVTVVQDSYVSRTKLLQQDYDSARNQAGSNDEKLRDYLGANSK